MGFMLQTDSVLSSITLGSRLRSHLALFRLDHWIKQLFVLPGVVTAVALTHAGFSWPMFTHILLGLLAVSTVASSNYVLNELLDAPYDRLHPTKRERPVPSGRIHLPAAIIQWIGSGLAGLLVADMADRGVLLSTAALWLMGCLYNIKPMRTKDVPYLDVLSESVNNPLRFCAGWYMVTGLVPPTSLLLSYWMLGAYFMALKRFSEYRQIGPEIAGLYRRSFQYYTEASLLNSVSFYAASAMLFFGAFLVRYRVELILSFPLIALLMAYYFHLSFENDSAVQHPEKLLREPKLLVMVAVCALLLCVLMATRIAAVDRLFSGVSA